MSEPMTPSSQHRHPRNIAIQLHISKQTQNMEKVYMQRVARTIGIRLSLSRIEHFTLLRWSSVVENAVDVKHILFGFS